jgi:hypothetical protein
MFAYCGNDPVNNEDPNGDIAWWVGAAVGGALFDSALYLYQTRNGGFSWSGLGKSAALGAISGVAFAGVGKYVAKGVRALVSAKKASKVCNAIRALPSPKWKATSFASDKLDKHFAKHAKEWGAGNITKTSYLKRARSLLNSNVCGDIKGLTTKEGWVFRYNARTNEFATAKSDGTIETLFRPNRGMDYWNEQVRIYGGN